ncbi:hypothetical protein BWI15_05755 [Kribbella sp. ALI-6-A]|uniref:DUF2268 domain-containing putative Zn-dependent protease n=1 Tax=Kribbella sp. ALI-6-A TaxID=1933817 RepID=UPI00097C6DE6|nr:DUF2268 domain-containing putative Zn-dependent protease [Kribbella sp. ALI-6-A]ONI76784.1 hypothetical protein BWI15_05755 [Kribbella sp. ALI-6-A]
MAIIVRNLVPEFLRFWQRAAGQDEQRQLALWHEYVERYPEVIDDLRRSGRTTDPLQALKLYPTVVERIEANAEAGTGWVQDAADLVVPVLDAAHLDLHAVVMIGVGTSNGWVSQFRGRPTLFLAVEQIPDTAFPRILAAHELAHAVQLPEVAWSDEGPLGQWIYSEGFATALTADLLPEYGLAEHLWFGGGYDDWLADCLGVLPAAQAAILADLDSEDDEVAGRYLYLNRESPFPHRIGYLVGTRLVQDLRRTYGWPELARWSPARAMEEVHRALNLAVRTI